jgi:Bacterial membrane protein YfhO
MSLRARPIIRGLVLRSPTARALGLLALLVVVLYADILFAGKGFYLLDVISYHVPMKWIVREVIAGGELPLWNRFYSAGQPLLANPAYEVFYPPQWLIWLPGFHFGFQLHIVLHFLIAAWGMYLLLRGLGAREVAALFGAAVFAVCGPYLSLATKLPLLFSLSWMPLALHCARRAILERKPRDVAIAALVLSMHLIIGEPTMAMQTWGLIAGYVLATRNSPLATRLKAIGLVAVLATAIAAIQLVPALDFTRDSVRSEPFEFRVVSNWSMPLVRPMEMFLPALFRNLTNEAGAPAITTMYAFRSDAFVPEMYIGLLVALLAVAGVLAGSRGAGAAVAVTIASVVVAAGSHTPLLKLLYNLGIFRSLRYPEKFILTAAFALIVWAALLLDRILAGDRRLLRVATTIAAIWLAIMAIAALAAGPTRGYFGWQLLRAAIAVALLIAIRRKWAPAVLIVLSVADLVVATRRLVPRMPRAYFDAPPLAQQLPPKPARLFPEAYWEAFDQDPNAMQWITNRTDEQYWWMFRNSLGDHLAARFGYELVMEDDVDRTALKTTDALLTAMKNLRARRAIGAEQPFLKIAGAQARVRYRPAGEPVTFATTPVEPVPIDNPRYAFADRIVRAASIADVLGRLDEQRGMETVALADVEPFPPARGEITSVAETANSGRIAVRAPGQAFLVMAVTAHRYWSATIDGKPATLIPTNGAYQGIVVPAGEHVIEMRYRNPMFWIGAAITLLALGGLLFVTVFYRASEPARD